MTTAIAEEQARAAQNRSVFREINERYLLVSKIVAAERLALDQPIDAEVAVANKTRAGLVWFRGGRL